MLKSQIVFDLVTIAISAEKLEFSWLFENCMTLPGKDIQEISEIANLEI